MNIVADTNVLVSGLLRPHSNPGEVVRWISSGQITLSFDARILSEYRDVLARPKFEFDPAQVNALLEQIESEGDFTAAFPIDVDLPDPDDRPFIEVALGGDVECLVTGNAKHYPVGACQGLSILTPREFVGHFRSRG